jgi:hypothetical protein
MCNFTEETDPDATYQYRWFLDGEAVGSITDLSDGQTQIYYRFTGLSPGTTYTISIRVGRLPNIVMYYDSTTVTTTNSKPGQWMWWPQITAGGTVGITAGSWNAFTSRLNEWRTYKGQSAYSFTQATQGAAIRAAHVSQARTVVLGLAPSASIPTVAVGGPMYASIFNNMAAAINAL